MHIIEAYSNHVGIKLPEKGMAPVESFFPIPEKYITIHPASNSPIRIYDYFLEVISWIKPYLDKEGIKIIQVGYKNDPVLSLCEDFTKTCNFSQTCYVLKNSLLHIGCDSAWMHVAGLYNIPTIALFGVTKPNITGPYYKHKDSILLESHRNGEKASLSLTEKVKSVNLILPEEVINGVFSILGLKQDFQLKSKYIGLNYHNFTIEYIPKEQINYPLSDKTILNIRMDREFNEQNTLSALGLFKSNLITNKPFSSSLFKTKNINSVLYDIKNVDDLNLGFVSFMHKNAIPYQVITDATDKTLNDIKLALFDFNPVSIKKTFEPLNNVENLHFKSSRLLICGNKSYLSYWHYLNNMPRPDNDKLFSDKVPNTSDLTFWENLDNLYVYETI